jgi:creatinine amidohydrolase
MKYEEMIPSQIEKVLNERPIAYIPWGSHEWHGPHNPVGLDTIKCYHQCLALCEETGGVVLPPVFCGYQTMKPYQGFKHTLEFRKSTVQSLVRDYLEQLYDEGFMVIVILMGHYGGMHVKAIRDVCEEFQGEHGLVRIWAFPDYEPIRERGFGGDHAGVNETSLMMHFRSDLVHLDEVPEEFDGDRLGVSSDPRKSSIDHGGQLLDALVEVAVPKIKEMLEDIGKLRDKRYGQ